jgi:chromosomal replication initiator protein
MNPGETLSAIELKETWSAVQKVLEQVVPSHLVQVWFQPVQLSAGERTPQGYFFELSAPNSFYVSWLRDRYPQQLKASFAQVMGLPCEFECRTFDEPGTMPQAANPSPLAAAPMQSPEHPVEAPTVQRHSPLYAERPAVENPLFDPKYTFETFVVGKSNQFAYAAALAGAEHPAKQYNPLFLHSPPGLGKTHLLHAIGNLVLSRNPHFRVGYLSAEKFVNELVESIQHKRQSAFRTKYRDTYDVLLIDDIQFIAGKASTEEEFFHTFNALHSSRRQIVLTSDRPPQEIDGLEERIRTRFEWGLVVDIQPPEIETRIAILKAKAEREDIYLTDEVATFLASYIKSNVRKLEGILVRLQAQASITGEEISLEMAKQALKVEAPEESSQVTIESIQAAVAKYFNLRVQDLKSASRARKVALPRQIAMFLCRKYTPISLREIGSYFGGKDHSTIIHALEKIEQGVETDPLMRERVEGIQNLL